MFRSIHTQTASNETIKYKISIQKTSKYTQIWNGGGNFRRPLILRGGGAPLFLHDQQGRVLDFRADQWVHLHHVTAQPTRKRKKTEFNL